MLIVEITPEPLLSGIFKGVSAELNLLHVIVAVVKLNALDQLPVPQLLFGLTRQKY